jgi:hypothetical protein
MPRWGAERRARPLHEVQGSMKSWASVLPQWEDRRKDARRIALRCGPVVRLSALRLPSFKGGVSWLGFFWRRQSSDAKAHRDNGWTRFATGQRTSGHGAATTHAKLSGAAHAGRVAGAAIARAQRFGPARAVRFAGIVPLLRRQAVPPGAHVLRRRPGGVRLEALVPQEAQA